MPSGMKLSVFTKETMDEWVSQGYDSVKITASDHLSVNDEPGPFFLLEPYNNIIDTGGGDMVQNIGSAMVTDIIRNRTGRFYQ